MYIRHKNWKTIAVSGRTVVLALVVMALLVACAQAPAAPNAPAQAPTVAAPASAATPAAKASTPAAAPAASEKPAAQAPPKPTGEVVLAMDTIGERKFDPSQDSALLFTYTGISPIWETLYAVYPPDGEMRPFLLESGTEAPDHMSWTLKLRDGIRFSNGDPMTAEDVKFSLDRFRSKESISVMAGLFRSAIKDVVVVDRLTTRVVLNDPMIQLPEYLTGKTGNEGVVLPKNYIEKVGWDGYAKQPIGSGAYKLLEYKPGESVALGAVDSYWRGTPRFAKLTTVTVREERARISMLKSGQADLIAVAPENEKELEQAGFKILSTPMTKFVQVQYFGAYPGFPESPVQKLEVRKALDLAVDKNAILQNLYAGKGSLAAIAPSVPGLTPGAPVDLKPRPYDPVEAKRVLTQAGYPNGFDITFYSFPTAGAANAADVVQAVAGYWEKIGIKSKIVPYDYVQFRPMYAGAKIDPKIVGTAAVFGSPIAGPATRDLQTYHWSKGTFKLTDVADAEIEKALAAKTREEMIQYAEAAYRKSYDNYTAMVILYRPTSYGANAKLADLPITKGWDMLTRQMVYDKP